MNTSDLYELFRSEMSDIAEPYLWSDESVFHYADEAQNTFCRKTDGIADASTPAVVQLQVEPGTEWLAAHPSILRIRTATRVDTGRPVEVLNYEELASRGWRFDGRTGRLCALIIGLENSRTRLYPVPNETVRVDLTVFRLPLRPITDMGDEPLEIPAQHHRSLLLWMKHLAYTKQDAETYDRMKAGEFEQQFLDYCESAKKEARRRDFKVREVVYGGI